MLIVDRGGGTGEVPYLVHLNEQRKCYVMTHELKPWIVVQVIEVLLGAGEEVVNAQDLAVSLQQPIDKMRAKEPGAPGDKNALTDAIQAFHFFTELLLLAIQNRRPAFSA